MSMQVKSSETNDYSGYPKTEFNDCFTTDGFDKISKKTQNPYFVLFKHGKTYKVRSEMRLAI